MYSALFAALALLAVNIVTGKIKLLRSYSLKDHVTILLISSPGTFFYYVFLYSGTAKMSASQTFIVNYLWPIMSPIMSVVFACIILAAVRLLKHLANTWLQMFLKAILQEQKPSHKSIKMQLEL